MIRPLPHLPFVVLLALGAGGCHGRWINGSITPVEERDQQRLERLEWLAPRVGRTTTDQVQKTLGPPDYATDDRLFWGYCIEVYEIDEGWHWFIGSEPDNEEEEEDEEAELVYLNRRLVVMQFDPTGVLRRQRRRRVPADHVPSDEFAAVSDRWRRETK